MSEQKKGAKREKKLVHSRYGLSLNLNPERRLAAAVIHNALIDIIKNDDSYEKHMAKMWIKSQCFEVFSFRWCCAQLDFPDIYVEKIREKYL